MINSPPLPDFFIGGGQSLRARGDEAMWTAGKAPTTSAGYHCRKSKKQYGGPLDRKDQCHVPQLSRHHTGATSPAIRLYSLHQHWRPGGGLTLRDFVLLFIRTSCPTEQWIPGTQNSIG